MSKKAWIAIVVIVLVVAAAAVLIIGNVHILYGKGFKRPKIIRKDSFTFTETYIDLDRVTGQKWSVIEQTYPNSIEALVRKGIVWRSNSEAEPPSP